MQLSRPSCLSFSFLSFPFLLYSFTPLTFPCLPLTKIFLEGNSGRQVPDNRHFYLDWTTKSYTQLYSPFLCEAKTETTGAPRVASSCMRAQYRGSENSRGPVPSPVSSRVAVGAEGHRVRRTLKKRTMYKNARESEEAMIGEEMCQKWRKGRKGDWRTD